MEEHKYTINPITGRNIRVGGKVFLKLLLELGYYYDLKKNYIGKEEFEVFSDFVICSGYPFLPSLLVAFSLFIYYI